MKKKSLIVFFLVLILVTVGGCHSSKKEEKQTDDADQIKIYYTNKYDTELVYETRKRSDIKDNQMIADTMIEWMSAEPKNKKNFTAIPSEVVINNVVARNNIVNIDFAVGYENLDKDKDVICRAAIVKTLVQIDGIDYVEFSIGGKTMMDSDGSPIGSLTDDSFVFKELPMKEVK
ncbi:MAG: GerMN domain-containing protein [Lachnospiraceae bacterium]|nr:GerMN domain-containing protein [Lachnospiraceae bacterium]